MADVGEFYRPYDLHSRLGRDFSNHSYIAFVDQAINQVDDIRIMVWDNLSEELWYA
jgi:hypothetical protein